MSRLSIEGGHRLSGEVSASGAKNAALPILAATILTQGDSLIENIPRLKDINTMIKMLNALNVAAEPNLDNNQIRVRNIRNVKHLAPYDLVTAMRASFFVAGPIIARTGFAKIPLPGGCTIGTRPIDIHLKGFEALGATIRIEHGFVEMKCKDLVGTRIYLDFPSVGATENIMMAATLAKGETIIENAAREPEIDDLAFYLNKCGAKIEGIGSSTITIQGVQGLYGCNHSVMADRIEAGTLMIAGAITSGDVIVKDIVPNHLEPVIRKLKDCGLELTVAEDWIRVKSTGELTATDVETMPFPGFPTDMQAQMMSLLCVSKGTSIVKETIFENRFMHANELKRMGAMIKTNNRTAIVTGVKRLTGAEVKITDLRAGAALILAGLAADGITTVYGLSHLQRGYDNLPKKLSSLGAKIL